MDAVKALMDDHKRIRGLIRQLDAIDFRAPEMRDGVLRELLMELKVHASLDRELFYPEVENLGNDELTALVARLGGAHDEIARLTDDLQALALSVEEHFTEEEEELFPRVERLLTPKLGDLGRRIEERRRELLGRPEFSDAQPAKVQNPHGGEQKRRIA